MITENLTRSVPEQSFQDTLDKACIRLQEKQAEYSIKRLQKLDLILFELEKELDTVCETADLKRR